MATADGQLDSLPQDSATARRGWVLAVVLVATTAPLVVAAIALAARGWVPVGEFAQAELRVRDFWAHPPDLGAVGRLRTATDVSSHPGPAAWWAMYPFYALFGRGAAALSAAVALTAAAWSAATLSLAWRKGGDALAVILGLGVLALMAALGPTTFLEPWNPWFAVMPFACLVIAAWIACDDGPWAMVAVVAAGTYCVQAHFGYAPLVALLGATALVGMWYSGPRRGRPWPEVALPLGCAGLVGLVMWSPPLLEQLTGDPGNIGIMIQAYREEAGREPELGVSGALHLVGAYLNVRAPWVVLEDVRPVARSADLGTLAMLVAWLLAAVAVWRRRSERIMASAGALMAVGLVGVLGAVAAASRIPGEVFGYLILWLGVLVVVVVASLCWVAWLSLLGTSPPSPSDDAHRARSAAASAAPWVARLAVGLLVVGSVAVARDFADPPVPAGSLSRQAEELATETLDSLGAQDAPPGPYLLDWEDPIAFGGLGTAVLSELERNGFEVGVDERLSTEMRPHRVLAQDRAGTAIRVVTGDSMEEWRRFADATEVAYVDPRGPTELARYERLRSDILDELREIDRADPSETSLAETLDQSYWVVRSDRRVDGELRSRIDELTALGLPTAVFLVPPGATPQTPQ